MPIDPSRTALALGNLSNFDIGAAARAIFNPDSLTPLERRTPVDEFFPDTPGYVKDALNVITDPFIAIGLALQFRFPIPRGAAALDIGEQMSALNKRFVPGLSQLLDFKGMFAGTAAEKILPALSKSVTTFRQTGNDLFHEALVIFEKSNAGKALTPVQESLLFSHLGGLDREGSLALEQLRGVLKSQLKRLGLDENLANNAKVRDLSGMFKAGTPLGDLATSFRKTYDRLFDETLDTPEGRRAINDLRLTLRQDGVVFGDGELEKIKDFVPYLANRSDIEIGARLAAVKQNASKASSRLGRIEKGKVFGRRGGMLPNIDDLRKIKGDLQGNLDGLVETILASDEFVGAPTFTMQILTANRDYVHALGRFKGFNIDGHGAALKAELKNLQTIGRGATRQAPQARVLAKALEDTYIPLAEESHNVKDGLFALTFESARAGAIGTLDGIRSKLVASGKDVDGFALKGVDKLRGFFLEGGALSSSRTAGNRLTSLFYQGALGLNPRSAAFNLLQSLNTSAIIGPVSTFKGILKTTQGFEKFFKLRLKGQTANEAFRVAFPEAFKAGVVGDPIRAFVLGDGEKALSASLATKGTTSQRIQAAMLGLFSTSESFVRMTAFNGGIIHATKAGLKGKEAVAFATRLAGETQFFEPSSQFLSTPQAFLKLPPVARQFATFATKQAGFLFQRGTVLGSGVDAVQKGELLDVISGGLLRGRNLGVAGRALLGGGLTRVAFKTAFNIDASDATISGGLPTPREFGPFAPFPLVPPIASVIGALASDATKGEFDDLKFALPLLIPGGVAATRAASLFSKDAAQLLGRKFADFNDVDQFGKVPLFKSTGKLIGRFSPISIYAQGAGIPTGDIQRTNDFTRRLLSQRDRVRGIRKQYIESLLNNDPATAERLNDQYKQSFGTGITYRPQDLRAAKLRRNISQLESVARSLPKDVRPQFLDSVRVFISQQVDGLSQLGIDPELLRPGVSARQAREGNLAFPASQFRQPSGGGPNAGRFTSTNNPGGGFLSPFGQANSFDSLNTGSQ